MLFCIMGDFLFNKIIDFFCKGYLFLFDFLRLMSQNVKVAFEPSLIQIHLLHLYLKLLPRALGLRVILDPIFLSVLWDIPTLVSREW